MVDISFHPDADDEYQTALDWYLARSPKAATGFVRAFERAVDAIRRFPDASPAYDDRHRFVVLRRYPYRLVHRSDPDRVRVVAVAHSGRIGDYWQGRT